MSTNKENNLVAPEYLSPSSIGTFRQCQLKFKFSKIDGIPDISGQEAVLGNFVHDVLEDLYRLPAELRTQERAKDIAREQWQKKWSAEASALIKSEKELNRFRWAAWWCIENLWLIENPQNISPHGMESFVRGEIGGVKVHGYIDRLSLVNGRATITDYKTGKTPKEAYLDDKFFQLIVYSQLLNSLDIDVDESSVELFYLKDGVRFARNVTSEYANQAIELIQQTKEQIDDCCKTGNFTTTKSMLCNWCGYKNICPAWNNR